jgi:hypothetical protein
MESSRLKRLKCPPADDARNIPRRHPAAAAPNPDRVTVRRTVPTSSMKVRCCPALLRCLQRTGATAAAVVLSARKKTAASALIVKATSSPCGAGRRSHRATDFRLCVQEGISRGGEEKVILSAPAACVATRSRPAVHAARARIPTGGFQRRSARTCGREAILENGGPAEIRRRR